MVITVEIYKQIRKMRLDGMSQRQIAASLHISRNTVKKYWDGDSVPWERKDYSREASVLTGDVVSFVRQCLDEDAHSPRKQHHIIPRNVSTSAWWPSAASPAVKQPSDGWSKNFGRNLRKPLFPWHSRREMRSCTPVLWRCTEACHLRQRQGCSERRLRCPCEETGWV